MWTFLRVALRLFCRYARLESRRSFTTTEPINTHVTTTSIRRFEESVAGKPYLIEVAAVAEDRWRAHLVRVPGVPTALMPFYGLTPDEAARHLVNWLTRAHQRAAGVQQV
jgi:hypothetical protein